jgi:myo-inositol-1(or 4)-monophosphatase
MTAPEASQATRRERAELLRVAVAAARAAAALIRQRASDAAALVWHRKSAADFVTEVDTAAEERIREIVAHHVPGAAVVGEELSPAAALGPTVTFVVDPLDGTTNFLHAYPAYAVSVGVVVGHEVVAGAVLNVPTGELYTATGGGGATRDGVVLRVSTIAEPSLALVGTGFPFKHLHLLDAYQRQFAAVVRHTAGVRRAGSAALDLADVAGGRFDAFWELVLAPWDFAAGALLIREAGGVISDLNGGEPPLANSPIVAGNPAMHRWLMGVLREPGTGDQGSALRPDRLR